MAAAIRSVAALPRPEARYAVSPTSVMPRPPGVIGIVVNNRMSAYPANDFCQDTSAPVTPHARRHASCTNQPPTSLASVEMLIIQPRVLIRCAAWCLKFMKLCSTLRGAVRWNQPKTRSSRRWLNRPSSAMKLSLCSAAITAPSAARNTAVPSTVASTSGRFALPTLTSAINATAGVPNFANWLHRPDTSV